MSKQKEYSIGLDIGVGSVGWACITPSFEILNYRGRQAIGTREFSSAFTAEERRIQRGTRRRYNRRKKRIQLLQQTIEPIFTNSSDFFMKTIENEKHFWRNSNEFENRTLSETLEKLNINPRKYPTIYHLRHSIISENKKFHPELIYLALHHLTKYRGHFLNENMQWKAKGNNDSVQNQLKGFLELCTDYGYHENLLEDDLATIEAILNNDELTKSDKRKEMLKVIGKEFREPITLIVGLKADIGKLFSTSENIETYTEEKLKIEFSKDEITEVYEKLTDSEKLLIDSANQLYQNVILNELLGTAQYVSAAKVKDYDQFGKDLKLLKEIYNRYFGEKKYREMFITSKANLNKYKNTKDGKLLCKYDQFIREKKNYEESFYKLITKDISSLEKEKKIQNESQLKEIQEILRKLEKNQFLLKQKSYLNAAIPYQNSVYEAEQILLNQQQFYPEISEEIISRVKKIISFRIPYYVGPLVKDESQSEFGWLIRKKDGIPVLPWNIDEVIDRSSSAEKFIQRMTSYCMYLTNEKVLPKHSLIYQRFEVLNELNGIQIRSKLEKRSNKYRLDYAEKDWIIKNVFQKRKNVSTKNLIDGLKKSDAFKYLVLDEQTDGFKEVFGTQKENSFSTSLSSFIDMTKIFGEITDDNFNMLEELIYWITVFEDKEIIKRKIAEKYPEITPQQINQLLHLNYSGWGRLSNKLLNELPVDEVKCKTMLEIMEEEPLVFMEVLGIEKYNLNDRIAQINQLSDSSLKRIKYKDIYDLQGSPALKKSIWQAVLIVEELTSIFGEPKNIMIEFAREEGTKRRTENRKKKIEDIRKSLSKDEKDLKVFLQEHNKYDEVKFQNQRFYLYVTQQGKCLYSGEPLDLNLLHEYEVDHIFPRHFVPDNSIDNLALVKGKMNQAKSGTKMPLEILNTNQKVKQRLYWKKLHDCSLISDKKYFRLTKESFTDQDKESFFARQLVETRQITKHVKNILQERFEETEVHTVNADIVTNLRKHSNITKIRGLNNKHHAVDAALAVVVVQFIINKYGHNFLNFNFKYQEAQKKWKKMMKQHGKNFFLFSDIDTYDKFHHYETGEVLSGRQFLQMINDELPWQSTKKIGTEESAFYKETLHSPKNTEAKYISEKTAKGVYSEMKNHCTYLISYKEENNKGKIITKSDFVDFYVIENYQTRNMNKQELAIFLANKVAKYSVIDAKIHRKIDKYQLVEVNGYPFYYISSGELHNAKQLIIEKNLLNEFYESINTVYNENIEIDKLRDTFNKIALYVNDEFEDFIVKSVRKRIAEHSKKINSKEEFDYAIQELFQTTSASAARSKIFETRYRKVVDPMKIKFINASITGLKRRRPESFRHELWSR